MMKTHSTTEAQQYFTKHKERFLQELLEFLTIPSISADSKNTEDVRKAALFVQSQLLAAGADTAQLFETGGHPIVLAEKHISEKLPTLLIYGHYDVQPVDPLHLWDSPPFEPVIKAERIYARGACDDKGQMFMHIKVLESYIKTGGLPCNVKFMFEGEEEVGSANLAKFVKENKEKLKADVILISDTSILSNENPSITVGLRGLSYMEVEVTGPNRDLHSGVYGGAVANPINVLCEMIASMIDSNGKITIDGFYDDVIELSEEDKKALNSSPYNEEEYKKALDIKALAGEKGYSTYEKTGTRPTLDVNGIWGGYTGEGAKTVLPSKAHAKISMRLVPNQNSEKISNLFANHFKKLAPPTVKVSVTNHHGGEPAVVSTQSIGYLAGKSAFEKSWGKTPIPTREGGSIPIVAMFQKELGLDSILLGFGLNEDAIHSPNESFGIFNFYKGIETLIYYWEEYAIMHNKVL